MRRTTALWTTIAAATIATATALVTVSAAAPLAAPADDVIVIGEAILASPATLTATTTATSTMAGCDDASYDLRGWRLGSTYSWYYNGADAPASVAAGALAAITNGTKNVVAGVNRCGITASLSMSQQYLGSTTRAAQIGTDGSCTGNDGVSVSSWGTLPAGVLGVACAYYRSSSGTLTASDMMLNKDMRWFIRKPIACSGMFDLKSVVVHERGHTFGLGHVSQTTSAYQVMSPKTRACDISKRKLNAGDLAGLTALYGAGA